ncbi:MAG: low molecular weight protein arginine phosphatase [Planctomycetes bacterium]|nr:low molecular weight protein arginine phosphatase [Planctomycetota bacterium]
MMDRGFAVVSAGIAAYPGGPASGEAVATLAKEGIDLLSHESQQVTERLLLHADQIYTMTRSHLDVLTSEFPEYAHRVKMLSGNRRDISDPFGGGPRDYQSCKDEIEGHIQALVDQIVVSS